MDMQKFWDQQAGTGVWASYYDRAATAQTFNFFERRQGVMEILKEDGDFPRVLDVGCGTGDYIEVADAHNGAFFGIDFAPQMVEQAAERIPGHGERHLFVAGSGDKLPFADNSFDLVLAMGYIEYFVDPDPAMIELRRVMKPGSTLVMQAFKWELFANIGRFVVGPMRRAVKGKPKPANGQPSILPPDWVDKKYTKRELDTLVARHGFSLRRGLYNNFHCLPKRMRYRFPKLYIGGSQMMKKVPGLFGAFAVNYIGKYRLDGGAQ
ncbi:MAG: class I SAM-dependent methyltransferase [Planctomycetota bacterium]